MWTHAWVCKNSRVKGTKRSRNEVSDRPCTHARMCKNSQVIGTKRSGDFNHLKTACLKLAIYKLGRGWMKFQKTFQNFVAKSMHISQRNQRYVAGHVAEAEFFYTQKNLHSTIFSTHITWKMLKEGLIISFLDKKLTSELPCKNERLFTYQARTLH